MTDNKLTLLALGTNLTQLGLDLNSSEPLYASFGSPFAETGTARTEPEFDLPSCYYLNNHIAPPTIKPALLSDETLMYIFYSMPNDTAQTTAAIELTKRDWKYHKEHQLWFQRVPNTELMKTATYERGSYIYFDVNTFDRVRKDHFVLQYDQLEDRSVPATATYVPGADR